RQEFTARYGAVTHYQPTDLEITIDSGWKDKVLRRQVGMSAERTSLQDAARLLRELHPLAEKLADEIELYEKNGTNDQALPRKLGAVRGLSNQLGMIEEAIRESEAATAANEDRMRSERSQLLREIESVRAQVVRLIETAERLGARDLKYALA